MMPSIKEAGVTSKAGFQHDIPATNLIKIKILQSVFGKKMNLLHSYKINIHNYRTDAML